MTYRILTGSCLDVLPTLPEQSAHCVVTSPPYFGLRDYGADGQIGLEPTPDEFVAALVQVFREVRRVLRDDGTLWLNLGDSYASSAGEKVQRPQRDNSGGLVNNRIDSRGKQSWTDGAVTGGVYREYGSAKPKDLLGIPWRVAFALQADGWYLRSDIIWSKPNPMPESVTDRPTKAHEYLFLLTKSPRYFYDADAIREPSAEPERVRGDAIGHTQRKLAGRPVDRIAEQVASRNRRSVWHVATQPFSGAHFATFPPKLIEPCILAGTSARGACAECGAPWVRVVERGESDYARLGKHLGAQFGKNDSQPGSRGQTRNANGTVPSLRAAPVLGITWEPSCTCDAGVVPCTVLDPFNGAATTGVVACQHGRDYLGIELNPEYVALSEDRLFKATEQTGLFASAA